MVKIVGISLLLTFIIISVKQVNNEYGIIIGIISSLFILFLAGDYLTNFFKFFNEIAEKINIDNEIYKITFKIIGIGYLIEFASTIIEDAGVKDLSDKLVLIGKIIILSSGIPVIYSFFDLITTYLL